ncbi:F-box protein: endocytic membrane traffic, recycling ReCYcling 1, partial [Dinochytrium kinnereticum]
RTNVGKVFCKLIEAIGERHMRPAFVNAIARLGKSNPVDNWAESGERSVNMDSLQFFELVHISDLIHQMVDVYYAEDVRPWVDENDFLSDLMVEKKSFDRSSDDNVASGMDKSIQVLINQVDHIMNQTHLPADYNPSDAAKVVFDLKPTRACATVVACLQAHVRLLQGSTHKDTLEVFLGETGIRLFK